MVEVPDFAPRLKRAIELAREAGLEDSAAELEGRAFAAYTTSSEWLGEVGDAIHRFRARHGTRIPREAAALFDECLAEVAKVWPKFK